MTGLEYITKKIDEFTKSSQEQIDCVEVKPGKAKIVILLLANFW